MSGVDWAAHMGRIIDRVGETATWIARSSGERLEISGVFTEAPIESPLGLAGMIVARPRFSCLASAVPGIVEGDRLEIRDGVYNVAAPPRTNATSGLLELELAVQIPRG
jgi:hypothetical protein